MAPTQDRWRRHELSIDTSGRQIIDLTEEVRTFCGGPASGLLHVFVPHATAGVALMETGSGSEADLEEALARLLPRDDRYRHRHGETGHGADHLLPALLGASVVIPVDEGELQLGTWQRVVLVDLNADNRYRRVRLSLLTAGS